MKSGAETRLKRFATSSAAIASAVLAVAGTAREAHAGDAAHYGALTTGRVTAEPRAPRPAVIGAGEHVPGIHVVAESAGGGRHRYVTIVGDPKTARAIRTRNHDVSETDPANQVCLIQAETVQRQSKPARLGRGRGRPNREPEEPAAAWSISQVRALNLIARSADAPSAGVAAVHSERVTERDGRVTLESIDAWVDPTTRGARLIARASLPLTLVGSAMGGVKIYAAREERPEGEDTKRLVHFVIVRPLTTATMQSGGTMLVFSEHDEGGGRGSACGHQRVTLTAKSGDGESAVVLAGVELPSADGASRETSRDTDTKEREVRTRAVKIHVGVSQTSRDKEPVVSVSYGWNGREEVQRVDASELGKSELPVRHAEGS